MSTKAHPRMRTDRDADRRSIVVGVDSRGRSAGAVVWAVDHAEREHRALQLVTATHREPGRHDTVGAHDLGTLARRLSVLEVDQRSEVGDTVDVLLDAAANGEMLVVGSRPIGPTQRLLLGSTSRAVATWSPVPVIVVPEAWVQPDMAASPIVVGVRPDQAIVEEKGPVDAEVLRFAFERADARRAPLVVVSAYEPPALQTWSPDDLAEARATHGDALTKRLDSWRAEFPDVDVTTAPVAEPAHQAVAEASRVGQLVVIGRHHSPDLTGRLGGTARGVLKNVGCPVAVVPAGTREELLEDFERRHAWIDEPWGPTY